MKLQQNQARRFERIFDALLAFTAEKRGVLKALRSNNRMLSGQTSLDLISAIWNEADGRKLIDEFIAANPLHFNRTDLREVESWKLGVYAHYVVIDVGPNCFFIAHDCAFNVRGINNEISSVFAGDLPGFVDAVVLPFDSTITVGTAILPTQMGAAPALRGHFQTEVKHLSSERRVANNARDFNRVAPLALAEKAKESEEVKEAKDENPVAYDFYLATDLEDTAEAKPLTDATSSEATPADDARPSEATLTNPEAAAGAETAPAAEFDRDAYISQLKKISRKGRITQGLKGFTSAFKKSELVEIASTFEGTAVDSSLKKGEIVSLVLERASFSSEKILATARKLSDTAARDLKRIAEAQGKLKIEFSDIKDPTSVPEPLFPYTQLYLQDDAFFCVMPTEVREALEGVSWDEV